jgi:glycyl-tRNA synthetase alpha chain
MTSEIMSINQIKKALLTFWEANGCIELDSYDMPVGAATFHLQTLMSLAQPKLSNVMFFQLCRRPQDARGSKGKDRLMQHTQFQVIMTPPPNNIQELVCESLYACGIQRGSLSFVENNWKSPTLGASGKGYEILSNGTEVMQFTYFQKFGGVDLSRVPVELAYGLERVCMLSQRCDDMFELVYSYVLNNNNAHMQDPTAHYVKYGDIYSRFEDHHALAEYDAIALRDMFEIYQNRMNKEAVAEVSVVEYESFIMANYAFNLLDASGGLSFFERDKMIGQLRKKAEHIVQKLIIQNVEEQHDGA